MKKNKLLQNNNRSSQLKSIRNKFDVVKEIVKDNTDILQVSETKNDGRFSFDWYLLASPQIVWIDFHKGVEYFYMSGKTNLWNSSSKFFSNQFEDLFDSN